MESRGLSNWEQKYASNRQPRINDSSSGVDQYIKEVKNAANNQAELSLVNYTVNECPADSDVASFFLQLNEKEKFDSEFSLRILEPLSRNSDPIESKAAHDLLHAWSSNADEAENIKLKARYRNRLIAEGMTTKEAEDFVWHTVSTERKKSSLSKGVNLSGPPQFNRILHEIDLGDEFTSSSQNTNSLTTASRNVTLGNKKANKNGDANRGAVGRVKEGMPVAPMNSRMISRRDRSKVHDSKFRTNQATTRLTTLTVSNIDNAKKKPREETSSVPHVHEEKETKRIQLECFRAWRKVAVANAKLAREAFAKAEARRMKIVHMALASDMRTLKAHFQAWKYAACVPLGDKKRAQEKGQTNRQRYYFKLWKIKSRLIRERRSALAIERTEKLALQQQSAAVMHHSFVTKTRHFGAWLQRTRAAPAQKQLLEERQRRQEKVDRLISKLTLVPTEPEQTQPKAGFGLVILFVP